MSQANVDLARRSYEAFQRGDIDTALDRLTSDFVLIDPTRVDTIEYHGRAGFDTWLMEWLSTWEDWRFVAEDFIDAEPEVVMLCRQWGRGRGSGIEVEQPFAMVWTFRGGAIIRMRYFDHWNEALEAVGRSP